MTALILIASFALSVSAARAKAGSGTASTEAAIRSVFGHYGDQAVRVARCESGLSVWAHNGQYLGLFQMGSYARSRFGHSWDAWGQARSAYAYFRAAGYSWRPWTCGWAA